MRHTTRLSEDPNLTIGVLEAGPDLSSDPEIAAAGGIRDSLPVDVVELLAHRSMG